MQRSCVRSTQLTFFFLPFYYPLRGTLAGDDEGGAFPLQDRSSALGASLLAHPTYTQTLLPSQVSSALNTPQSAHFIVQIQALNNSHLFLQIFQTSRQADSPTRKPSSCLHSSHQVLTPDKKNDRRRNPNRPRNLSPRVSAETRMVAVGWLKNNNGCGKRDSMPTVRKVITAHTAARERS